MNIFLLISRSAQLIEQQQDRELFILEVLDVMTNVNKLVGFVEK